VIVVTAGTRVMENRPAKRRQKFLARSCWQGIGAHDGFGSFAPDWRHDLDVGQDGQSASMVTCNSFDRGPAAKIAIVFCGFDGRRIQ